MQNPKQHSSNPQQLGDIADEISSLSEEAQAKLFRLFGYGITRHLEDDALVDSRVAATELGVSVTTLNIWRCTGRYHLPFVKIGRLVKYRMGDLREFKQSRRVDTRPISAA